MNYHLHGGAPCRYLFMLALIIFSATGASGQKTPAADTLVGCYALELGEWQPSLLDGNQPYQTPPDTVHLSEQVGGSEGSPFERGNRLVRPVIDRGRTPSAYWSREDSERVRIVWTNGFSGVRLDLSEAGGGMLTGVAEAFTDVRGPALPALPTTEAELRRIQCGATPEGAEPQ